jgi:hypothetical protein
MEFWIAAVALPVIGGLHRYACSLGYRNATHTFAFREAARVSAMLAIIVVAVIAIRAATGAGS